MTEPRRGVRVRGLLRGFVGFFWPPALGDCPHIFGSFAWLGLLLGIAAVAIWTAILV